MAAISFYAVDPVRNPYAPGAGQRPPELAGRDREISQFEVVLERVARRRPERSMVLTGLRGVGKTVLLNTFRSMAMQRLWGTGKIEARPEQSIRRPIAARAAHGHARACAAAPGPGADRPLPRRAQGLRHARPEGAQGIPVLPAGHRRARGARPGRLRRPGDRPDRAADRRGVGRRRPRRRHRAVHRRDAGRAGPGYLRALRRLPRAVADRRAADRGRGRACRTFRRCCRRARATPSGCSVMYRSTGWTGRPPTTRCSPRPGGRAPTSSPRRWTRCTRRPTATRTSCRPTAR